MPVIDVTSIDDLAKMAEHQNTMILHMMLNFLHYYLVQGNGTMYRYVFSTRKHRSSEKDQASRAVVRNNPTQDRNIDDNSRSLREDATGYVINIEKVDSPMVHPVETQVLRKIRI
jgi:hypothetical protein